MQKRDKQRPKLKLQTETIRQLSDQELNVVAVGFRDRKSFGANCTMLPIDE